MVKTYANMIMVVLCNIHIRLHGCTYHIYMALVNRCHQLLQRYVYFYYAYFLKKCISQEDVSTSVHANVPARALGWEDNFKIPRQFDIEIMSMIEKKQITPKVRNHVVREVAARMLDHCLYPTKDQYQVVATKIVQEFPVLSDTLMGTGYVSVTSYPQLY